MTLTPLAPLQGPQPQAVGTLPGIPAPMQPVAGAAPPSSATSQPWFQDVQSNFQAAHGTFDPLAAGLATGEIGVPHPGVAGWAVGVVPQDPPGTTTQDNGGGNWQPGPNSTQYNNGVDQGPQTQGYNRGVGPGYTDSQGNWIPDTGGALPTTLGPVEPGIVSSGGGGGSSSPPAGSYAAYLAALALSDGTTPANNGPVVPSKFANQDGNPNYNPNVGPNLVTPDFPSDGGGET